MRKPEKKPGGRISPETARAAVALLAGLAGAALVAWSLWEVYRPAAGVFVGLLLWRGAVRLTRKPDAQRPG